MTLTKWKVVKDHNHTLVIASHNFPHIRKGIIKKKDISTGRFVQLLCRETKSWGLISTAVQKDPNWYIYSPFRIRAKKLIDDVDINVVFDIHGRRSEYPKMVEFFPNKNFGKVGRNLLYTLPLKSFRKEERLTIVQGLDRIQIPCLEVEIRRDARIINSPEFRKVFGQIKEIVHKTSN